MALLPALQGSLAVSLLCRMGGDACAQGQAHWKGPPCIS